MTCRYYGISRPCFYKWLHRYEELGEEGLRDGSSRPLNSPEATKTEVVGQDRLPAPELPLRAPEDLDVPEALSRHHDQPVRGLEHPQAPRASAGCRARSATSATRTAGSVTRSPCRATGSKSTSSSSSHCPGSRKKYYQYTAIDDCTRIRVLRIYPRNNQKSSIQFLDYVLEKLPFQVEVVQTDNGAEFQGSFHWHLLDRGIGHVYIKPATPRLNGKVERSHRIDTEEFYRILDGVVVDDAGLFNEKLQEWEDFYNFHRPHGGLGGQTPYERLRQRSGITV